MQRSVALNKSQLKSNARGIYPEQRALFAKVLTARTLAAGPACTMWVEMRNTAMPSRIAKSKTKSYNIIKL